MDPDAISRDDGEKRDAFRELRREGGYLGVSTWAPYASLGGGVHYDTLTWRESLRYDKLTSAPGVGFGAWAGVGVERALATRSALTLEARLATDSPSVGDAKLTTRNIPGSRRVPVEPGTQTGIRVGVGYLRIF